MVGIVGYGRKIFEYLGNALVNKGIVAGLLDFHKVGNVYNLVDVTELPSFGFAILVNR